MNRILTVDLDEAQINLIIRTLLEKRNDLDVLVKNQDGLGAETIRDILIEHRELGNVIRDLRFYTLTKTETEIETETKREGIDKFYNGWIHDTKDKK